MFCPRLLQSWWVSLTESLGLFADDGDAEKDAREALRLANEAQVKNYCSQIRDSFLVGGV
jgi:hypothetical protein